MVVIAMIPMFTNQEIGLICHLINLTKERLDKIVTYLIMIRLEFKAFLFTKIKDRLLKFKERFINDICRLKEINLFNNMFQLFQLQFATLVNETIRAIFHCALK